MLALQLLFKAHLQLAPLLSVGLFPHALKVFQLLRNAAAGLRMECGATNVGRSNSCCSSHCHTGIEILCILLP